MTDLMNWYPTRITSIRALIFFTLLLVACKKESKTQMTTITVNVGGVPKSLVGTTGFTNKGDSIISFVAHVKNGIESIGVILHYNNTITIGTYKNGLSGFLDINYTPPDYTLQSFKDYNSQTTYPCEVNITSISHTHVEGTFSAILFNSDENKTLAVSDGKFSVDLTQIN